MDRHVDPPAPSWRLLSRASSQGGKHPAPALSRPLAYSSAARRIAAQAPEEGSGDGAPSGANGEGAAPRRPALWRRAATLLGFSLLALVLAPGVAAACPMGPGQGSGQTSTGTAGAQASGYCASRYIVRAGDTLSDIALRCRVSLLALQNANPHSDPLSIGRILIVPGSMAVPSPVATAAPVPIQPVAAGVSAGGRRYSVRTGDTLSAIALQFSTTVDALARYNGLTNANRLQVGQVLGIPRAVAAGGR